VLHLYPKLDHLLPFVRPEYVAEAILRMVAEVVENRR
jgi:hypothetical protein